MAMVLMEGNGNGGMPKGFGACLSNWIATEWEKRNNTSGAVYKIFGYFLGIESRCLKHCFA